MSSKGRAYFRLIETKEGYSVVKASVETLHGRVSGCFYVDTGSSTSLIVDDFTDDTGKREKIVGLAGSLSNTTEVEISFRIEGVKYHDVFHSVNEDCLPLCSEDCVLGILGCDFLSSHKMVVDYRTHCVYCASTEDEMKEDRVDTSFIPLLSKIQLPLIRVQLNGKQFLALIDSGSAKNIISHKAALYIGFNGSSIGDTSVISGLEGDLKTFSVAIRFKIPKGLQRREALSFSEDFDVLLNEGKLLSLRNGELSIDIVLGNQFLNKHQCLIDLDEHTIIMNPVC